MKPSTLLNLATYAYDGRVKMAARMVLDYVSAKVAVSSADLRRAPPFRRRNETEHYGPITTDGFLASPLLHNTGGFEPDPQGAFYAMLAGNTAMLKGGDGNHPGFAAAHFDEEMVHSGLCDYRVPEPILDLLVNWKHRQFYQSFHHRANDGVYANELYYGSPSYLISAGGNPTDYSYQLSANATTELILDYLLAIGDPPFEIAAFILALEADPDIKGLSADLGAAMPTTFIPTSYGDSLDKLIQFGKYAAGGNPGSHSHLGVAPDFACGRDVYIPNEMAGELVGHWPFINRGHPDEDTSGYYLAIYSDFVQGNSFGFMEAYDTWLHPGLSYEQFKNNVLANHDGNSRFNPGTLYSYTTQSGYTIRFQINTDDDNASAEIVQGPGFITQPDRQALASGTILNSEDANDSVRRIRISNPAFGAGPIILDLTDPAHGPIRTSETGVVERTGVPYEVWANFGAPQNIPEIGDFGAPCKTLARAHDTVAPGGTVRLVPGSIIERITLYKPMTLTSFPGGAIVGSQ